MADSDSGEGPKVVWTFPLIRRFQSNSGILNIGQRVQDATSSDENIVDVDKVKDRVDDFRSDDEDTTDDVEEDLEELEENRRELFSDDDDVHTVEIEDNEFNPKKLNISEGDEVVWENRDSKTHKIMAISGEQFGSGDIEPGGEYRYTFSSAGANVYVDSIEGGDVMSGAVIVGNAELDEQLPSEQHTSSEDTTSMGAPSLSQAADEKKEMMESRR